MKIIVPQSSANLQEQEIGDGLEYGRVEQFGIERASVAGPWAWDVRLNQLSGGKFYSRLQYVSTPDVMLYQQYWHQRVEVLGAAPKGCIMLGVNINKPDTVIEWCGETLDQQGFSCAASGSEIDFKTPERNLHIVLLVKAVALEKALGYREVACFKDHRHIKFTPSDSNRLIANMKSIIHTFSNVAEQDENLFTSNSIEALLFGSLAHCLEKPNINHPSETGTYWKLTVRNALMFVESCQECVTVLELAAATGVSQRTIEYAFKDQLGMTPSAYLRLYRLNAAHRELADTNPDNNTVTKTALKWGFSHQGRFSLAHRNLFGETPFDVLKK